MIIVWMRLVELQVQYKVPVVNIYEVCIEIRDVVIIVLVNIALHHQKFYQTWHVQFGICFNRTIVYRTHDLAECL